jgi:hypothetical protein
MQTNEAIFNGSPVVNPGYFDSPIKDQYSNNPEPRIIVKTNEYSVNKLIEIFHFILKEQLHFSKILLLHQQQKWEILLKIGIKGSIVTDELIRVLSRSKEITTIDSSPDQLLSKFQTIVPVFHQKEPLAYLLLSENHFDELSSKEHLNN